MRDPKRIDNIVKDLEEYWKLCPDLRLGQLIENLVRGFYPDYTKRPSFRMYCIEDDMLHHELKKELKRIKTLL